MRNRNIQGPVSFSPEAIAPAELMPYGESLPWKAGAFDFLWPDIWVLYLCGQVSALMGQAVPQVNFRTSHIVTWPHVVGRVDASYRTMLHPLSFLMFTTALWCWLSSLHCVEKLKLLCCRIRLTEMFVEGSIANTVGFVGFEVSGTTRNCRSPKAEIDTQ